MIRIKAAASLALAIAGAPIGQSDVTAPGPKGPLAGTYARASAKSAPVVLIIPGSGPTDRDGNSPLGVSAAPYRMLAQDLSSAGVSSVRVDKRGLFGSRAAFADPNAVTIKDYADDVHSWVTSLRRVTRAPCIWLLGHSEGGIVALTAAQDGKGICGVILVATPGRRLGDVMREQLKANPANAPVLPDALRAIDSLEHGKMIDVSAMHPALASLFSPKVQRFTISLLAIDPVTLAGRLHMPVLIIQGQRDVQVSEADAVALSHAAPRSQLLLLAEANHVLKVAPIERAANLATYGNANLPLAPGLVSAIVSFIRDHQGHVH